LQAGAQIVRLEEELILMILENEQLLVEALEEELIWILQEGKLDPADW
jgi:hypothetical protein